MSTASLAQFPGAQTDLVVSLSSRTQDGIYIAASYNVNTLLDPVMDNLLWLLRIEQHRHCMGYALFCRRC